MVLLSVFMLGSMTACAGENRVNDATNGIDTKDTTDDDRKNGKDTLEDGADDLGEDMKDGARDLKDDVEDGARDIKDDEKCWMTGQNRYGKIGEPSGSLIYCNVLQGVFA